MMSNEIQYRNVYTVAEMLGVGHHTVRQWIRQGTLEAIKIGRRVLIPQSAIDNLIAEAKKGAVIEQEEG